MLAAHDTKFQAALESAGDGSEFILPKAKIEKMAEALVLDSNIYRANLGKSILHFMTTKEITLEEKDVLKSKPDFDNCTSEIDYTKVKISFPKLVEDGGGFTVYFKEIPTTTSNVQPTTEITNQN